MYPAIAKTRNINIEASSPLLDTTSTEERSYQYNMFLLDRYQYFDNLYQSSQSYLTCITRIFLTSSPIYNDSGPSCRNTSRRSDHPTPIIGLSDQTHLTNFSRDKKPWPVYMTISNIISRAKSSPPKGPSLLLPLLLVPLNFTDELACANEASQQPNSNVLYDVFNLVLVLLQQVALAGTVIECAISKNMPLFSEFIHLDCRSR